MEYTFAVYYKGELKGWVYPDGLPWDYYDIGYLLEDNYDIQFVELQSCK